MKNIKVVTVGFLLLCISFTSFSQTEQGNILLGGTSELSFASATSKIKSDAGVEDEIKATTVVFSPVIGFFVIDDLTVGAEIPVSYSSTEYEDYDASFKSTSITFAPFIRYYFGEDNIKPYLHGEVGFGFAHDNTDIPGINSEESSSGIFQYEVEGGFAIFLNDRVSVDVAFGYRATSAREKEDNISNERRVTGTIGLGIGIVVVL